MDVAEFCTQSHVVVVAGKGGVGKTTVTAALGLIAARAGKTTSRNAMPPKQPKEPASPVTLAVLESRPRTAHALTRVWHPSARQTQTGFTVATP